MTTEVAEMTDLTTESAAALRLIVRALDGNTQPFAYSELVARLSDHERETVRVAFNDLRGCGLIERGTPGDPKSVDVRRWCWSDGSESTIGAYRLTPAAVA